MVTIQQQVIALWPEYEGKKGAVRSLAARVGTKDTYIYKILKDVQLKEFTFRKSRSSRFAKTPIAERRACRCDYRDMIGSL